MKKRHSIQILLAVAAIFFAATACTQDGLTDDTRLPEGQYPLQIAAVTLSVEGGEAQPWGRTADPRQRNRGWHGQQVGRR